MNSDIYIGLTHMLAQAMQRSRIYDPQKEGMINTTYRAFPNLGITMHSREVQNVGKIEFGKNGHGPFDGSDQLHQLSVYSGCLIVSMIYVWKNSKVTDEWFYIVDDGNSRQGPFSKELKQYKSYGPYIHKQMQMFGYVDRTSKAP